MIPEVLLQLTLSGPDVSSPSPKSLPLYAFPSPVCFGRSDESDFRTKVKPFAGHCNRTRDPRLARVVRKQKAPEPPAWASGLSSCLLSCVALSDRKQH